MKRFFLFCFLMPDIFILVAQNHYSRFESIDIQHYIFEIHLNDTTNKIEGKATIFVKFVKPAQKITLDLVGYDNSTKTGMKVSHISVEGISTDYSHKNNQLVIHFHKMYNQNEITSFIIEYDGIPADGLIISKNKFGDRTFFGDNWPNRARYWLPTVDHPSDKSTLEFRVFAPEQYQVVANGYQVEESNFSRKLKFTHWKEDIPLSTKLMVIGVARFAVLNNGYYNGIPISSWVFPQNREAGFKDYSVGKKPLKFFTELIGTYSYEKLANVQSKTRYGGMENAGCIFYSEKSVTGNNNLERLFAHEIAHQWFGNSVTEQNWHHLWLSEGFATYLTHVYIQHYFGDEIFRDGLIRDRNRVINYARRNLTPIIDTTVTEYARLLNTNTYQKASWFLHMLHEKTGDSVFYTGLQKYYRDFQNSTALTKDFQYIMEGVSGQELDLFFYQWLCQAGHPKIKIEWKQLANKRVTLKINQTQPEYLFTFPLDIEFQFKNGERKIETVLIDNWTTNVSFWFEDIVKNIQLDPSVKLLFEKVQ